jgi:hypothetical protein
MKRLLFAAALALTVTPLFAADVGVSVSIGQPGFYGRLDIGGFPPPQVIYRQPIAVQRVAGDRPPIYLHVPPGHARNWRKHCHEYNACGERVLFVRDSWYNHDYVPRYQKQHPGGRDRGHDQRRDGNRNDQRGEHGHGRDH